jgi:NADH dehydrogenase (ubiquinone) 1 alpha subcomplex subunit 5
MLRGSTRVLLRTSPLRMAGALRGKQTTGIVGLEVDADGKNTLLSLYAKTLTALEGVPAASEYRKTVEGLTKERLAAVNSTSDLLAIEAKVGAGQIEQLIQQAQDELKLIPTLIASRAFDSYDGSPAEEILTDLKRCEAASPSSYPIAPSVPHPPQAVHPFPSCMRSAVAALPCSATTSPCGRRSTTRRRVRSSWSCQRHPRTRTRPSNDAH